MSGGFLLLLAAVAGLGWLVASVADSARAAGIETQPFLLNDQLVCGYCQHTGCVRVRSADSAAQCGNCHTVWHY